MDNATLATFLSEITASLPDWAIAAVIGYLIASVIFFIYLAREHLVFFDGEELIFALLLGLTWPGYLVWKLFSKKKDSSTDEGTWIP
jgi:positive regulator of sigma E activity